MPVLIVIVILLLAGGAFYMWRKKKNAPLPPPSGAYPPTVTRNVAHAAAPPPVAGGLPDGWQEMTDPNSGAKYYYNSVRLPPHASQRHPRPRPRCSLADTLACTLHAGVRPFVLGRGRERRRGISPAGTWHEAHE